MEKLTRITFDPAIMGGKPCIRGMRVTVGMIVGMLASGHSRQVVLDQYPYLESEDAQLSLSVDGKEDRWSVRLVDGLSASQPQSRISYSL